MAYPIPERLHLPVEPYSVEGYTFRQRVRRRWLLWATHLGDDVVVAAGTKVTAIGEGEVVWSEMRVGSAERPNWGGLLVIGHTHRESEQPFFSVYGHLRSLTVQVGEEVVSGRELGVIAEGNTPENGWWKIPHLHFGIYTGPWEDKVLPGYKRIEERRTKVKWWQDPQSFISAYNLA